VDTVPSLGRALTFTSFASSVGHKRAAVGVTCVLIVGAAVALFFARNAGPVIAPFLPAYITAVMIVDGITAYLLFRQFAASKAPSFAVLGGAYLYTTLIVVPHILTFPNVFSPTGLLGAGPQTAVWLWALWHAGFPLLVLCYAFVAHRTEKRPATLAQSRAIGLTAIVGVPLLVLALAYVVIAAHARLPVIIARDNYNLLITTGVGPFVFCTALAALAVVVVVFRGRNVANLWLAVGLVAALLDIAITLAGGARYSVGWYCARLESLFAASAVLGALIYETGRMAGILAQAEGSLRSVVDGVADALLTLDAAGCVRSANPAATMLFGYDAPELIGKHVSSFVPNFAETQVAQAGQSTIEALGKHHNGRTFPIEIAVSPVASGDAPGTIVIARDITQRKRAESAIAAARDQALEAARLKAQFLATMSHEIRTPINAVIGMSELLLETPLLDEQREYAETVRDSADALLEIINDILDFSKLEAGKMELDPIAFSPRTAVEAAADILASAARKKRLNLVTYVAPDVPSSMVGDANRLRQILLNLIGNAIKFTATGGVVVRATVDSTDDIFSVVRFAVTDTGIGIEDGARKRLFNAFEQADGSTSRRFGGTGLGLSISKKLVEMMGGEIGVDSRPNAGATFWFTARFERLETPDNAMPAEHARTLRGTRALIVDDDPISRQIVEQYLMSWGVVAVSAAEARSGLEAMRAAKRRGLPFQVALVDYQMPDLDGMQLGAAIKADPDLADVRLILMTAFDEPGRGRSAVEHGFSGYLRKPLRQSALYEAFANALASDYANFAATELPVAIAPLRTTIDDSIAILIAEDNPVNRRLALQQLKRLGYHADAVSDGEEAIAAVATGRYTIVLMDCQMPNVDGLEASRAIRRAETVTGTHIPIVAMTANALEGDREMCLAAGMDDYIAKPVQLADLRRVLATWTLPDTLSMTVT
jgi:PAS domain S-box-containing protein